MTEESEHSNLEREKVDITEIVEMFKELDYGTIREIKGIMTGIIMVQSMEKVV